MNSNNPIFKAAFSVFGFWWLAFTLIEFGGSPFEVIENWGYVSYSLEYWIAGTVGGLGFGIWLIWFQRVRALNRLYKGQGGNTINGVRSTLGFVPMLAPVSPRVDNSKQRLPIQSKLVQDWIEKNREAHPEHVTFFLAVWDVYSAHKSHPATHRRGGHANRHLWQHCMAVTETALQEASTWKYDGVYAKKRGKAKYLIIAKRNPEYEFDHNDPLIPVIALAHDFGKLEAYKVTADGQVVTREEGSSNDPDDDRIFHDSLGARMLARLPEYWKLSARDRRAINLVIGHYHHPSAFPVDANGLALDDRMSALMEFLIFADKKTGMMESGRDVTDEENEITEEQSEAIYKAFVDIITEYGRVNGTGNKSTDATFKIAQKHDGLIVVKELELRRMLLAKIGWSLDEGEARYRVTMNLLYTLGEKGLLYDRHKGIDFSRYHPMYSVSFRSSKNGQHISSWEPVIIFKPLSTTPEFAELGGLPNFGSRMVINKPLYTHNPGIRDPEALRDLVRKAFGDDVARSITIAGRKETKSEAKARENRAATELALTSASSTNPAAPIAPNTNPTSADTVSTSQQTVADIAQQSGSAPAETVKAEPQIEASNASENVTEALPSQSSDMPSTLTSDALTESEIPAIDGEDSHILDSEIPEIAAASAMESEDPFHDLLPPSDSGTESMGSIFEGEDSFGDFPAIEPSQNGHSASSNAPGKQTTASLEQPLQTQEPLPEDPVIVDRPGVAIPDKDMPNVRKKRTPQEEAEALQALATMAASSAQLFTKKQRKSKPEKTPVETQIDRVKKMITDKAIPLCGNKDGFNYVLILDIKSAAADIDVDALIKSAKLPSIEAKPGFVMIGVPE